MSWIVNPEGDRASKTSKGAPKKTGDEEDEAKIPDPSDPTRLVSAKAANRPFLVHQQYRQKMQQEHEAWEQRQKIRAEKVARGEEVGPEEPDPTAEPEVGCLGLLKFLLIALVVATLAGKFLTGSYLWEHELPDIRKWIPSNQRLFTEDGLAQFDGSQEGRPIYLAIDGDVYDVTAGRATYGPGGSYHHMAGKDAARAFATGCFATHQTYDIRGLDEAEMRGLNHWKKFYADSNKYHKVGRVLHKPIDPSSPIPEHCDEKKRAKAKEKEKASAEKASGESESHEEL